MSPYQSLVNQYFTEILPRDLNLPLRQGQLEMALKIAQAFENGNFLVSEAGTGIGKSLAYLIPSALWIEQARKPNPTSSNDSSKKLSIVISTFTKALQQQIIDIDVPRLTKNLGFNVNCKQARGRGNYICINKLVYLSKAKIWDFRPYDSECLRKMISKVRNYLPTDAELEFEGTTKSSQDDEYLFGIRSEFNPSRELWSKVESEQLFCKKRKCRFFEHCFFYRDRRLLEEADIIIANHSLLLADIVIRSENENSEGIFPRCDLVVVDEAHHLEEVATSNLGYRFQRNRMSYVMGKLCSHDNPGIIEELSLLKNLLKSTSSKGATGVETVMYLLDSDIPSSAVNLDDASYAFFDSLKARYKEDTKEAIVDLDWFNEDSFEADRFRVCCEELKIEFSKFLSLSAKLVEACQEACFADDGNYDRFNAKMEEFNNASLLLQSLFDALNQCLMMNSDDLIYYLSLSRYDAALIAAPMEVGPELSKLFYHQAKSIIFTSATLTAGKSDFFESRVGLNLIPDRFEKVTIPSPFDYQHRVLLSVPTDISNPQSQGYLSSLVPTLTKLIAGVKGRTLILSTSWSNVTELASLLSEPLNEHGIEVLSQQTSSRNEIINRFRRDCRSVLIGTDTFWEGIDVPGEALSCVVILQLPFAVPYRPIFKSRSDKLASQGKDPFKELALPMAVTKFRQGFGRLIRSKDDRGLVFVCDKRLKSMYYGKHFLNALPTCQNVYSDANTAVESCINWLNSE